MTLLRVCCVLTALSFALVTFGASTEDDSEAAALATLAAALADTQRSIAKAQSAVQDFQEQHRDLLGVHSALQLSHNTLSADHKQLATVFDNVASLHANEQDFQRRTLASNVMCKDYDDAHLIADGAVVFEGDAIVVSGDEQVSVADAVATATSNAVAVDALRDWMCLPSSSGTLAKLYQSVSTLSATSASAFQVGNTTFLAVTNTYNGSSFEVESAVYRFNETTTEFELFQDIPTSGASLLRSFSIGERDFLAVANQQQDDSNVAQSPVLFYNTSSARFEVFQQFETLGARAWEHFRIGGTDFLAVANMQNDTSDQVQSVVYRYDNVTESFEPFQAINTSGAIDWEHIATGNADFLAVANYRTSNTYNVKPVVYVYNSTSAQFEFFQEIDVTGVVDLEHFRIGDVDFLAVMSYYDGSSYAVESAVYRYDNAADMFVPFQVLDTIGALDCEPFQIGGTTFLAVANYYDGSSNDVESVVYRYDEVATRFQPFQSISTGGARDWEYFSVGETHFLALSEYVWGTSSGVTSVFLCDAFCFTQQE